MLPMLGTSSRSSRSSPAPSTSGSERKTVVTAGALGLAVGPFLLSVIDAGSEYSRWSPGLTVTGIGAGLFYPSVTTAAVTALDPSRSSLAGGIVYMFQIAGGAIGLGITTTIFTTTSENEVADEALRVRGRPQRPPGRRHPRRRSRAPTPAPRLINQFPNSAAKLLGVFDESFVSGISGGVRGDRRGRHRWLHRLACSSSAAISSAAGAQGTPEPSTVRSPPGRSPRPRPAAPARRESAGADRPGRARPRPRVEPYETAVFQR